MEMTEVENWGIDAVLYDKILEGVTRSIPALKGMHLTYLDQGRAGLAMRCQPEHANHMGTIHGAIISGLLDNAMGYSIETLDKRCVTLDMTMNFIAPVMVGKEVKVEGCVLHAGNKTVVAEASLFTGEGRLAAKSTGTFYVLPGTIRERNL